MDKKWVTIIILAALTPIIIIAFALISPSYSPSNTELEQCNTLEFNNDQATNIVFFSNKNQATKYKEFFQETSPFNRNKEAFNFYYIDSYAPKCELYKGIAIFCHNKELIKKGASCPNDYLIALEERSSNIRSSAYENVISINTAHPLTVLTHEFGHAFGNLAEEYTPAKIPRGTENCVQDCADFKYEIDGCYEGCSQSNYQRSISSGVMRTLSSNEYGMLNEGLIIEKMKKASPNLITGKAIETNCQEQDYYLIEGKLILNPNNENSIELISKTLAIGCVGTNGNGNFDYELQTSQGARLTEANFNPEFIFTEAPGDSQGDGQIDGEVIESDKPFILKIPKISQGEQLLISESGKELINVRLNDIGGRACKL